MNGRYVMALDAGTTSVRAIIFNENSEIISIARREITQVYPVSGWVEHDPMEIWSSVPAVAIEAMVKASISPQDIDSIGITNQRETVVVWDKNTGMPVYNAIVWQCRRTAAYCDEIADKKEYIRQKTGLILDPYFSATKIRWILDHVDGARERAESGELVFGTIETWLVWKLTKGRVHVSDYSNASRTMLFNIHSLNWDDELLDFFGIPKSMVPKLVPNSGVLGVTDAEYLGANIRIGGCAGDQQAALFGQGCMEVGDLKNTYGTGCFLLMSTGDQIVDSKSGLLSTVAWVIDGKATYALEGSVFMGGAIIQWLRDELGIIHDAAQSYEYAMKVKNCEGCYVVPAFTGLGAPYWQPNAKGIIMGLSRKIGKYHIVRAALDSIAYQVNDVVVAMEQDMGRTVKSFRADGGASDNDYLMQMQADISSIAVRRAGCIETTALGAAYMAGLATGFWKCTEEIIKKRENGKLYEPVMSADERKILLGGWHEAISLLVPEKRC